LLDDKLIPERLREHVDSEDLEGKEGRVMLLHGLTFFEEKVAGDGQLMGLPVTLTSGELVKWKSIPRRTQESLKEGYDYTWAWTEKDHLRLRYEETVRQQMALQSDPLKTYDIGRVGR
jgi:hypothetical protein